MAKKNSHRWAFNNKLLFITIVITFVFLLSQFLTQKSHNKYDSSLTGEEIIEAKHNKIPKDVAESLKTDKRVLGVQTARVPILMYHYIEYPKDPKDTIRASLTTTPYTLEQEIKTLLSAGYNFMTVGQLADVMDGKLSLPQKPIILTFDDSYADFYTNAYPILKKYKIKATQYVISGFLDSLNHLSTKELQEIAKDNLVEIGAHTVHHFYLKGLPEKTVSFEVSESKKDIENIIHKPIISFAYPFGAFDLKTVNLVQSSGFKTAVSTVPGIDQPKTNEFFLYRLRPGGRTGQNLLSWLESVKNN